MYSTSYRNMFMFLYLKLTDELKIKVKQENHTKKENKSLKVASLHSV